MGDMAAVAEYSRSLNSGKVDERVQTADLILG
jgi:hypothetical protein